MASELIVQTIQGPSSGSNANKVIIPSGQTLYAPGHVLQVVQGSITSQVSTTSTTAASTGLSASITPKSTSSDILVLVSIPSRATGTTWGMEYKLYRGGSSIHKFMSGWGFNNGSSADRSGMFAATYLDSPATTSSTTYEIYFNTQSGTDAKYASIDNDDSFITLMEIAQ